MRRAVLALTFATASLAGAPVARADSVLIPGSPLQVRLDDTGSLDVQYAGSPWHDIGVAGPTLYPFAEAAPFGVSGNAVQTVSAPALAGSGTAADPYVATVETEPASAVAGVSVRERVTYVNGGEQFTLGTTVQNTGDNSRTIRVAQMGNPLHGPTTDGSGTAGSTGGLRYVEGINTEQGSSVAMVEVPTSPWNTFADGTPARIGSGLVGAHMWDLAGLFDNAVDPTLHDDVLAVDFAAGVRDPLASGASASYDVIWRFGRFDALSLHAPVAAAAGTAVTVALTARNHGDALAGRTVRYAITGANPGGGAVTTDPSGGAAIGWLGARAGTDHVHAFLDADGNGVEGPGEAAGNAAVTVTAAPAAPVPPAVVRPAARPSNAMSVLVPALDSRARTVTLRFRVAGPGSLRGTVTATVGKRQLPVARFRVATALRGVVAVKATPSRAVLSALRRRHRLTATVRATFTPAHGVGRTVRRSFTLRG